MASSKSNTSKKKRKWLYPTAAVVGTVAAIAVERAYVARDRARPDPDADEPFGAWRGDVIPDVVSRDGTALHVEEWGSGPTIVLSHGYCLNLTFWHYQIADLSRDFRVVAYDQRGHGRSGRPGPDGSWSLDALAEDLDAVIAAAGGGPVVVVGHSMGGMTALQYARDFPEAIGNTIAGLVLVDTTAADVMDGIIPAVGRYLEATIQGLQEAAMRAIAGNVSRIDRLRGRVSNIAYIGTRFLGFGPDPSPSKVEFLERVLREVPSDVALSLLPTVTGLDVSDVLDAIDVPTLIVVGSHDRLTPPGASQRLADAIKQSELFVLQDAGHSSMFEKPNEFNARVRQFLERVHWA
jgi:pimeloyl-ACP methyl ester carboxylesterase